jgi:CPA2 family monovalent cation:H+ antiporter-2
VEETTLLRELAVIAVLGVAVTVIFARLRLPTVAGLLVAGALLGPSGFGLIESAHSIELLAEVGVVLLLFTIGLEFSLQRLKHILGQVAVGAGVQVGLTVAVTVWVASMFGEPLTRGLFYGFVFALSSTAIVLRALHERREVDAPHGRFIVGTLIFQDLCVVPMVLIVPLLSGGAPAGGSAQFTTVGLALLKAALVVVITVVAARRVVPTVLRWVDASRSREVFLLAVLALCIGTAWLTSLVGLSLALGAFLGGMVVADTEYGHRAMGDILPLRDAFVSVFFVSLGMLFDLKILLQSPGLVLLLLLGFLLIKGFLATIAALVMRFPARVAWLAGVGLAQFGEFGFVLCNVGVDAGLVDQATIRPLLAAGILSMFLTPILVHVAPHVTAGELLLAPLEKLIGVRGVDEIDTDKKELSRHVVVVGFGVAGKFVVQSLTECKIPYVVLELNAETVRIARAQGQEAYYADATSAEALTHAHLKQARALVLLMNDPQAAQRVVDTARRLAPEVPILMRTRYLAERRMLMKIGASDVVAEEVEGGMEVLARLLRTLELPRNVIDQSLGDVRAATQTSERKQTVPRSLLPEHRGLADLKIENVQVLHGSPAIGRSTLELDLRQRTGASIVAVRRGGALLEDLDPKMQFLEGDVIYLVGALSSIQDALHWIVGSTEQQPSA